LLSYIERNLFVRAFAPEFSRSGMSKSSLQEFFSFFHWRGTRGGFFLVEKTGWRNLLRTKGFQFDSTPSWNRACLTLLREASVDNSPRSGRPILDSVPSTV
jgi:hypothetical protein